MDVSELNQEQREAVVYTKGPMLVLAGAGSGKTKVLTYKAAYLMAEQGVAPESIMLTTFTNKAAEEMQQRLVTLSGLRIPFAGTFHSLCARLLRMYGTEIGIDPGYVIYDSSDQLDLLKLVIGELRMDVKEVKPRAVMHVIEQAKHELITPSSYREYARGDFQVKVASIYSLYQRKLSEANALDFNDLLIRALDMLQRSQRVRETLQYKIEHVLVDEYQDTNTAQYQLTKILSLPQRNLCVVGDASQAIYSWRGANYKNLQSLERDFPDIKIFKLERNYRSTPEILTAANGVVAHNTLHPILDLWTQSESGMKVKLSQAVDEYDEVKMIVKTIKKDDLADYSRYAILYRTNAQSRVVEEVMVRQGIPYQLVGGVKFYERKEIKDVLSYIRYAYNPRDKVSLERMNKLGKRRLRQYFEWLQSADISKQPTVILDQILRATGYLDKYDPKDMEDAARIENVRELSSVAQHFATLEEFLENVALVEREVAYSGSQDNGAVTLMTLHAAKGLEFDVVFMIGLEEGLFPHSQSLMSREEIEEERRLCYVGMTRAKKQLLLSYTKSRLYFGSRSQNPISRFVGEIPEHVLEIERSRTLHAGSSFNNSSPIDDDLLEKFLSGEIDVDEFIGR